MQSVVAYCEALACCARTASGVEMILCRAREVCMLESLPSSPEEGGLLSGSLVFIQLCTACAREEVVAAA